MALESQERRPGRIALVLLASAGLALSVGYPLVQPCDRTGKQKTPESPNAGETTPVGGGQASIRTKTIKVLDEENPANDVPWWCYNRETDLPFFSEPSELPLHLQTESLTDMVPWTFAQANCAYADAPHAESGLTTLVLLNQLTEEGFELDEAAFERGQLVIKLNEGSFAQVMVDPVEYDSDLDFYYSAEIEYRPVVEITYDLEEAAQTILTGVNHITPVPTQTVALSASSPEDLADQIASDLLEAEQKGN